MSIDLEKRGAIALMTFNNPSRRNAMTPQMRRQMEERVLDVRDDPAIRVLVMTGAGDAFCAGGDITTFGQSSAVAMRDRLKQQHRVTTALHNLEKPVIAAVHGPAFGVGFSISLLADVILASDTARFCQSYSNMAIVPDGGGLYLLARVVGAQRAREMILLADIVDAATAKSLGIVREVYPAEQLMAETMKLAERLANGPTRAYGLDKSMLNRSWTMDLETFLELESVSEPYIMETEDHKEGIQAFLNKRKPVFKGM
ncbi:MAG TPA: enoyl-CoA hydratase [Rhodocyclaceae bacterium]|nr:enoyl-CoA hydratase [Rhodocyclaceae bacterium]